MKKLYNRANHLVFGLNLHKLLYFVCMSSGSSGQTVAEPLQNTYGISTNTSCAGMYM